MNEMSPDQIRAMHASQQNRQSPKLHSSIFNRFQNKGNLSEHGKKHLHKFADLTKKSAGKINQKRVEIKHQKTAKLHEINWRVNEIKDSNDSDTEKIAKLQRLLNDNHKDIDHALLSRIQLEMRTLHGTNTESNNVTDHAERLQQESAQNNPNQNTYWNPSNPEPKVIGHDHNTHQDIYDDDSRSEPQEQHYDQPKVNVADILNNERINKQVKA